MGEKKEEEKKTLIINRSLHISIFPLKKKKIGIFENKKIFAHGRKIYLRGKGGRKLRL